MKKILLGLLAVSLVVNVMLYREYLWVANKAQEANASHEDTLKSYRKFQDEVSDYVKERRK